jgi:hypothetical protein
MQTTTAVTSLSSSSVNQIDPQALGEGNNMITNFQQGVPIQFDQRFRTAFTQLKNSFPSYRDEKMWTHVTVHCTSGTTKSEVIEILTQNVFDDVPFFACYYQVFTNFHEFYLYRNFDAMKAMMAQDLSIPYGRSNQKILRIQMKMNVASFQDGQVNWTAKVKYCLSKRIINGHLNLDGFARDPIFSKLSFSISSKANFTYLLDSAKKIQAKIHTISAKSNNLVHIKGFECLSYQFPTVKKIDLRENIINSFRVSKNDGTIPRVKEILIDKNPICSTYFIPVELTEHVVKIFTDIEKIDGVEIDQVMKLPLIRNFFVTNHAYTLVDEFVKCFFGLYDDDRKKLIEFYTPQSIFTLSACYEASKSFVNMTTLLTRMQPYLSNMRNILRMANMSKGNQNVFNGADSIMNALDNLPRTKHHISTFCVDVPLYIQKQLVVIKISGVFDDFGNTLVEKDELLLGFSRTFVLGFEKKNNYVSILNDQLFVYNTKYPTIPIGYDISSKEYRVEIDLEEENQVKLVLFKELTSLKQEMALQLLSESFFDLKIALGIFKTLMENGNVKEESFDF